MGLSLKPRHLKRYKDIASLLLKYGDASLVERAGLEEVFQEESPETGDALHLADDLEKLGPSFVKLGQLLSTRADLLPASYLESLERLQDRVEPFSFEEVERSVSEELGVRISKAFQSFEEEPVAAASLGQVHRARLRDGREVAVKVQRPGIRAMVLEDLEVLSEVAEFLESHSEQSRRYGLAELVEEFRRTLAAELDYLSEARNMRQLAANLEEFERILIPLPVEDYTTSRVLTMEFVPGRKITALSPLARMEVDGEGLADELFRAYLRQVLVDGFFHADPHPGNVFITPEGGLALIDLGMVAFVAEDMQEELLRLLLAIADGRGREAAEATERMGDPMPGFDPDAYRREVSGLVSRHQEARVEDIQVGQVTMQVTRLCAQHGLRIPSELSMLGKALMNLDQIAVTLAPGFDPNAAIRREAADLMRRRAWKNLSPSSVASSALDMGELMQHLPARLNRLLELAADNRLSLKVDAVDEVRVLKGLEKIANRIAMGLVIAALILGAALLMRVETDFTLLGYPALATLFFLLAAGCGFVLVFHILRSDREDHQP